MFFNGRCGSATASRSAAAAASACTCTGGRSRAAAAAVAHQRRRHCDVSVCPVIQTADAPVSMKRRELSTL